MHGKRPNLTAIPDVGADSTEFRYYAQNISAGDFTFFETANI